MDKIYKLVKDEKKRQEGSINLIASENYAPREILDLTGSVLTNKYAEGLPGKRYYGGTKIIDEVEQLAINRVKKLFKAEHANVQPHSGASANLAAYFALLNPGDKVLAQGLSDGGHLTHGLSVNFSGKIYRFKHYHVDHKTGFLDYGRIEKLALRYRPKMIIAGYSAYSRVLDFKRFRKIADRVNAYLLVDMAHFAGLVAAGVHPSPVKYADVVTSTTHKTLRGPRGGFILCKSKYAKQIDRAVFPGTQGGPLEHVIGAKALCFKLAGEASFKKYGKQVAANAKKLARELGRNGLSIVSGGTDNHMFLVDTKSSLVMTGKEAEQKLEAVGIIVNKNTIPGETESSFVTSGIRLGTPAMTTRGMKEKEMELIGMAIVLALKTTDKKIIRDLNSTMRNLARKFPVY